MGISSPNFLLLLNLGLSILSVIADPDGGPTTTLSPLASLVSAALRQYSEHVRLLKMEEGGSVGGAAEENPETRGGGGYGHSSGHGHGYGAITLDPVSIISLLALGAFLINNILQLLRSNAPAPAPAPAGGGRRFQDAPIQDSILSSLSHNYEENGYRGEGEPNFGTFFENLGSLYYLQPKKRNICIKKVVCGYVNAKKSRDESGGGNGNIKTSIFDFML